MSKEQVQRIQTESKGVRVEMWLLQLCYCETCTVELGLNAKPCLRRMLIVVRFINTDYIVILL